MLLSGHAYFIVILKDDDDEEEDDDDDDCFYIALFSALSSRLTALACDST